ncbi:MAG TPA: zinc-ribbon domain-containing protein [Phycisphaerae bacterium]|nr:zinc-ribbon domain-containing protein [Phycisphaerae bacterium]
MNELEKICYLQNVIRVGHADEVVAPEENAHLESVRAAIRATKSQLRKARESVGESAIDLAPLGRFSFRLQNLEDMIEMALADGTLDEEEKRLLIDAAKRVGVTQDQVNLILTEAKSRREREPGRCPNCGIDVAAKAKFCPGCGAHLTGKAQERPTSLAIKVPDYGITITFAESTGTAFPDALALAKRMETFQEALRSGKRWYGVTAAPANIDSLLEIAEKLRGLRNREVFVAGKKEEWDSVFGFVPCCAERAKSYRPIAYCFGVDEGRFNIWGCKLATPPWGSPGDWCAFGKFLDVKTFEFDHERIKHELKQRLERARYCPYLRRRFVSAVLEHLPKRAKVTDRGDWGYRETYDDTDPRAVVVQVVRDFGEFKEKQTIRAIGVEPSSPSIALDIVGKAARASGEDEIDCNTFVNP